MVPWLHVHTIWRTIASILRFSPLTELNINTFLKFFCWLSLYRIYVATHSLKYIPGRRGPRLGTIFGRKAIADHNLVGWRWCTGFISTPKLNCKKNVPPISSLCDGFKSFGLNRDGCRWFPDMYGCVFEPDPVIVNAKKGSVLTAGYLTALEHHERVDGWIESLSTRLTSLTVETIWQELTVFTWGGTRGRTLRFRDGAVGRDDIINCQQWSFVYTPRGCANNKKESKRHKPTSTRPRRSCNTCKLISNIHGLVYFLCTSAVKRETRGNSFLCVCVTLMVLIQFKMLFNILKGEHYFQMLMF